MKKKIIETALVLAFASVSLFAKEQEEAFVITQFRCADIADKINPEKWITLFNLDARHPKSITIVSTWIELVDLKTDKVFARKKVEFIPIANGRLFIAIGFEGAHTATIYPSCILEYKIKGNDQIRRIIIQDPRKPVRNLPEKFENIPVPKEFDERKPPALRPNPKKKHKPYVPDPESPRPTALV